jgi:hypothetical protein
MGVIYYPLCAKHLISLGNPKMNTTYSLYKVFLVEK